MASRASVMAGSSSSSSESESMLCCGSDEPFAAVEEDSCVGGSWELGMELARDMRES